MQHYFIRHSSYQTVYSRSATWKVNRQFNRSISTTNGKRGIVSGENTDRLTIRPIGSRGIRSDRPGSGSQGGVLGPLGGLCHHCPRDLVKGRDNSYCDIVTFQWHSHRLALCWGYPSAAQLQKVDPRTKSRMNQGGVERVGWIGHPLATTDVSHCSYCPQLVAIPRSSGQIRGCY